MTGAEYLAAPRDDQAVQARRLLASLYVANTAGWAAAPKWRLAAARFALLLAEDATAAPDVDLEALARRILAPALAAPKRYPVDVVVQVLAEQRKAKRERPAG